MRIHADELETAKKRFKHYVAGRRLQVFNPVVNLSSIAAGVKDLQIMTPCYIMCIKEP